MKRITAAFLVSVLILTTGRTFAQSVQLSFPDTTAKRGDTLLVPVRVSSLTGLNVLSGQITFSYLSGQLQVFGIETNGTITQGLGNVVFNATTRQLAFATTTPLTGSGDFVKLKVAIAGSPSTLSDSIKIANAVLNEGSPAVTIRNGRVRVLSITLSPKNPPGTIVVGDSVQFTLSGDVLPSVTWSVNPSSVGTIDATGKFKGVTAGQLKVYAEDSRGLKDSSNLFAVNPASLRSLTVSLRDTSRTRTLSFDMPVTITDVSSLGIISGQFTLTYSGSVLQAVEVVQAGTKTELWSAPVFSTSSGRVDVALAGSTPLSGSGTLVYVRFRVLATAPGQTSVALSNVKFNETIQANLVNATVTPLAAPVLVISPSTAIMTRGGTLQFAVTSGGTPPYTWSSSQTTVGTIDAGTGLLTAHARGTTTISVVDALGFTASSGSIVVNDVRATLPDSAVAVAGSVDLPLLVEDLTGLGILSYQFRVVYDPAVVRFGDVVTTGTMSSAFTISARDTLDTLRIAAAGTSQLAGGGILLKLRFDAVPTAAVGEFSTMRLAAFRFNEAGPSTPTATTQDGRISIGTLPPSAPVLSSPANGANNIPVAPILTWSRPANATSYRLQVSTTATFDEGTVVVDQGSIADTLYSLSGLQHAVTYYWRISAVGTGGTSSYSVAFGFTTVVAPPAAPVANAATGISSSGFVASWSSVSGATEYRLDISTDNFVTFVPGYENLLVVGISQAVSGLTANTSYAYRVRAGNIGGASPHSNVINLTTLPPPPSAPQAMAASGITQNEFRALWLSMPGVTGYQLDVSSDNFVSFLAGYDSFATTDTFRVVTGLIPGTQYQYRVRAVNSGGPGANSSTIFVTTLAALPTAPTLTFPPDLATGVSTSPTFSWTGGTGETFTIEIATTSSFETASLIVQQSGIATTSHTAAGLQFSTTYYWRVRATNVAGTGPFSVSRSFTTQASPPPDNPAPTISSLVPPSAARGDTTDIAIHGANFLNAVTTFSFGPDVTIISQTIQNSLEGSARIAIPLTVPTGPRTVTVMNTTPGGGIDSLSLGFTIVNPVPTLTRLLPDTGFRSETMNVMLMGKKFIESVTSVSFGDSILVNGLTVNGDSSLIVDITINSLAAPGPRTITVTNAAPGGGAVIRTDGFVVVNPPPSLTALSPAAGARGQTIAVLLTGRGFIPGVTSLLVGSDITVDSLMVQSSTTLRAVISISATAAAGPRDISIVNNLPGGGSFTLPSAFSIGNPAPILHAIVPDSALRGGVVSATVHGANFIPGATSLEAGSDITVSSMAVVSDSVLTAQFSIPFHASAGVRPVTVTIAPPGGGTATLASGFTVLNPVPAISSITPATGSRGSQLKVSVIGSGFYADATSLSLGPGISVVTATVVSPTELSADISIDPAAAPGSRPVSVTNTTPGGGTASLEEGFVVTTEAPTNVPEDRALLPARYELFDNYPNPFNPSTTIRFSLPHESSVHLTVHSLLGTEVATVAQAVYQAGFHTVRFEAGTLSTGLYLVWFEARATGSHSPHLFRATKKLLLLR